MGSLFYLALIVLSPSNLDETMIVKPRDRERKRERERERDSILQGKEIDDLEGEKMGVGFW